MFYDESASSRQPLNPSRLAMISVAIILLPPFITLAAAPVLLMLLPVAWVAIPFMIPAFFGGTHSNQVESHNIRLWRPALAVEA
jgi:hypothetical protein